MSREVILTSGMITIIDDDDYERVMQFKWCYDQGYAARNIATVTGRRCLRLHRFILNEPSGLVDHINQNKLDNRKENLRVIDKSVNALNRRCRGTTQLPSGKWRAQLRVKHVYHSKIFLTEAEANNYYLQIKANYVS